MEKWRPYVTSERYRRWLNFSGEWQGSGISTNRMLSKGKKKMEPQSWSSVTEDREFVAVPIWTVGQCFPSRIWWVGRRRKAGRSIYSELEFCHWGTVKVWGCKATGGSGERVVASHKPENRLKTLTVVLLSSCLSRWSSRERNDLRSNSVYLIIIWQIRSHVHFVPIHNHEKQYI